MNGLALVIGNKNYSSWSLRPWLAMKVLGREFEERPVSLYVPGAKQRLLGYSPAGKVPILIDGERKIWDSLAILEYLAESHPSLWPAAPAARALARSISAEMHSGFAALRQHMSMNIRKRHPGKGRTPESLADIARIVAMWSECRARFGAGGSFLFGGFGAADAMYAPVVARLHTYDVAVEVSTRAYMAAVM
ncbi:MAG: glutathione S-transferase, partial [Burkholderiales bacterium]